MTGSAVMIGVLSRGGGLVRRRQSCEGALGAETEGGALTTGIIGDAGGTIVTAEAGVGVGVSGGGEPAAGIVREGITADTEAEGVAAAAAEVEATAVQAALTATTEPRGAVSTLG